MLNQHRLPRQCPRRPNPSRLTPRALRKPAEAERQVGNQARSDRHKYGATTDSDPRRQFNLR
jgi:hypothetical protein